MRSTLATSLEDLEVLVVDCQTTGATPTRGSLLEVAWAPLQASALRAGEAPRVEAHVVRQPENREVPRRIRQLTGIGQEDLAGAREPEEVLRGLDAGPERLRIAHYARFEKAFLPGPHRWICTHEIACRLLPGLPRRGLRALAGRLGHPMKEAKRAGSHVEATAFVWTALVERLRDEHGVETLQDLDTWLEATTPARRGGRDFAVPREARLALPDRSGVYRMRGKTGEILYVGKATSLKTRVNSWFQKRRLDDGSLEMLTQVWRVETEERATPLEAALFETDEIKRLRPPYNTALRERGEAASFLGRAFDSVSTVPDEAHGLGPFAHEADAKVLPAILRLLRDDRSGWDDLPTFDGVDLPLREGGLALFLERHGPRPSPTGLLKLGFRLRAAARAETGEEATDEADPEAEAPDRRETPEGIADLLEGTLRHATRLVRRGRWLSALVESSIVWQVPRRGVGEAWRLLVVEGGRVIRAEDVEPDRVPPAPPGWPRCPVRRLRAFDGGTLDRMRVLATELKRVATANCDVRVCLGPRSWRRPR